MNSFINKAFICLDWNDPTAVLSLQIWGIFYLKALMLDDYRAGSDFLLICTIDGNTVEEGMLYRSLSV